MFIMSKKEPAHAQFFTLYHHYIEVLSGLSGTAVRIEYTQNYNYLDTAVQKSNEVITPKN